MVFVGKYVNIYISVYLLGRDYWCDMNVMKNWYLLENMSIYINKMSSQSTFWDVITDVLSVYLLVSLTSCLYRFFSISSLFSFCSGSTFYRPLCYLSHVITSRYLPRAGGLLWPCFPYGYELPPSFPPQTLTLVF